MALLIGVFNARYGPDSTQQLWKDCANLPELVHKAVCKDGGGLSVCRSSIIKGATTLDQYCTWRATLVKTAEAAPEFYTAAQRVAINPRLTETKDECLKFADPRETLNAYGDWYNILDRNYEHHEKARN